MPQQLQNQAPQGQSHQPQPQSNIEMFSTETLCPYSCYIKPLMGTVSILVFSPIAKICILIGDLPVYRSMISNDEITRATRSDLSILLHLKY